MDPREPDAERFVGGSDTVSIEERTVEERTIEVSIDRRIAPGANEGT